MIAIGVPVGKNHSIDVRTAAYISAEASRPGVGWGYVASRECGVGRSTFIYNTLKDPAVTHVYCMDGDVVPPNGTLQRLLSYDLPIVAGIYSMCTNMPCWSFRTNGGWQSKAIPLPKKLMEVSCIGGSTILIKREVFEKIERPWFKVEYKGIDEDGKFFDEAEDEYFSRIAQEAGYKLVIDPTIICKHYNYREL